MDDSAEKLRAEVRRYRNNGWHVTRLRPGGKMAYEKDWPDLIREAEDFEPGENVGVRFGPQSGGLVDVDLDYDTARRLAGCPAFGLDHLVEFGRSSLPAGGRGHRLVVVPDAPNRSRVFGLRTKRAGELLKPRGLGLTVVEIRGSNGSQTAFPPSVIRAEGKPDDRLIWTDPDATIPELSWTELSQRVGRLAFCALAAALYPADDRDAFCFSIFGALIEAAVDVSTANEMVAETARVAGDKAIRNTAFDHGGESLAEFLALTGLEEIGHIVRSWLGLRMAETDAAPLDRERDGAVVQGDVQPGVIDAETLRRLLDPLDPEDFADYESHREMLHAAHHASGGDRRARQVFIDWCARSDEFGPGKRDPHGKLWSEVVGAMWDRSSIDRHGAAPLNTIGTILRHLLDAGHGLLVAQVRREIGSAGSDFDDDLQWLDDEDGDREADARAEPIDWSAWFRDNWVAIGQRDIAALPPTPWLMEGLLLYNEVTTIGGRGGSGKSLLAWMIVCSVATGKALAWFPAPERPRKVLVISGEDSVDEIERRVSAACQAMGIKRADLGENFMVWSERTIRLAIKDAKSGKVSLTKLWHGIRWAVEHLDVGLVATDPLIKGSSGFDESSNDHMEELYGIVRELTSGHDCAALTVDHFAKGGTGGDQASIRGASAKVDAARVAATLTSMTEAEHAKLRPPQPREAYVLYVDPKQNYARKTGGHWMELVEFEVGNGETRPSLVWRRLDPDDGIADPQLWPHRAAFLSMVADGRAGQPWSITSTGPRDARLAVAMTDAFELTERQARAWIEAFAEEGSITVVDWVRPNRTVTKVWAVNPDYQTEQDAETEAMRG
ncbi:hypothetical protein ATER59S_01684 [Aquamicrobium terrae]